MEGASFVEELQHAMGPENIMPVSELLNGVFCGRFPGPVDYRILQDVLRRHDRQLVITNDKAEFRPVTDASTVCLAPPTANGTTTPHATVQAQKREIHTTGCIKLIRFVQPATTSHTLDLLQQRPDTLKLILENGAIELHQILPTNHRGGLAHQKRIGKITPTPQAGKPRSTRPNPSSHAVILARARRSETKSPGWWRIMTKVFPKGLIE